MLAASLGLFLALAPAAEAVPCNPFAGAQAFLQGRKINWLVVGEIHGTREIPEAFADLVCAAAHEGRKVVVALELPVADQDMVDAFMASDGGTEARERFLAGQFWQNGRDGRSSEAMFALLDSLRMMRQEGDILGVEAIKPGVGEAASISEYEKAMAGHALQASREGALTLVLVGSVHAQLRERSSANAIAYLPMAAYLPRAATRTLQAAGQGGSAWTCLAEASNDHLDCGEHDMPEPDRRYPRGMVMLDREGAPYDGYLNTGAPFTASPPQVDNAKG
ncbi:MAG: hypothetical protein CMH85_03490 [Novosphingobium sp.]|uniref:Haem-binding uptake Tiki superfamily ChaN domain-containing protein n=1 Tax=Novosphingobium indicum TaxID=462949 RepID=A0ABQ2JYD7_9SPHN|nr:hypothetical protein [Novosphingobium indicum]MAC57339.1 hypothetical protein [Novosphingobium sp.]GGN58435.1 hypothetical protein GCM10011349_37990 [Novosphingobium indicum]